MHLRKQTWTDVTIYRMRFEKFGNIMYDESDSERTHQVGEAMTSKVESVPASGLIRVLPLDMPVTAKSWSFHELLTRWAFKTLQESHLGITIWH